MRSNQRGIEFARVASEEPFAVMDPCEVFRTGAEFSRSRGCVYLRSATRCSPAKQCVKLWPACKSLAYGQGVRVKGSDITLALLGTS
jgi:hypothetical protein